MRMMHLHTVSPPAVIMLRLCRTLSRNPAQKLGSLAGHKELIFHPLASMPHGDLRRAEYFSSIPSLPASAGPSSFGLSLDSLEAYVSKLAERNKRAPTKRRSAKRALPPPTEEPVSFDLLGLSPLVRSRLGELQLVAPTEVQHTAIPLLLQGDDAAIQSYTGSGKTLAYLLPILSRVGPLRDLMEINAELPASKRGIEAIIVAPSRELGMQIVREAERVLGVENKKAVQQLVGGANRGRQEEALRKNKPLIVVGTPGRISEISRDGKLHTHDCRFLVLDEADELLSIQFREDMRRILEHVGKRKSMQGKAGAEVDSVSGVETDIQGNDVLDNKIGGRGSKIPDSQTRDSKNPRRVERQTILVSATMPMAVLRAAAEWGQNPVLVRGKTVVDMEAASPCTVLLQQTASQDSRGVRESMPPSLQHFFAISLLQHRVDTARKCIHAIGAKSVIIFMNHPRRLKDTVFKLEARGISAAALHGELGKLERTNTLAAFKNGKIRVLVTSEVGARGIDVPECDLVVNLELPTDMTHYAHRAGRTGRLGRKGTVVSICEQSEAFVMRKFERQLGVVIEECEFVKGGLVSSKDSESNPRPELVKA